MDLFLYFLDNKLVYDPGSNMTKEESKDGIWYCMAVLPYRLLTKKPNAIRRAIMRTRRKGEVYSIIANSGWHFSYIGGVKKIIEKLEAFSHTEYNLSQYKDEAFIKNAIENGKDLYGRELEFEVISEDHPFPEYLKTKEAQTKFAKYFFRNLKA
jgi:beta-1,4-mannosyl-glycoprotein beta-1,4-N-acetylglucosaminyltransferase